MGNGDYMLDHTAALYVVNRDGQVKLAYPYGTEPADIVSDLRRMLGDHCGSASLSCFIRRFHARRFHAWLPALISFGTAEVRLRLPRIVGRHYKRHYS